MTRLSLFIGVLASTAALAASPRQWLRLETSEVDRVSETLEARGFDVAGHSERVGSVEVIASSRESVVKALEGLPFKITHQSESRPYRELRAANGIEDYYDAREAEAALRELEASYPTRAKVFDLSEWLGVAKTVEGRPLLALQVSVAPAEIQDEPKVLVIAQHHARELTTHHTALDAARELLAAAETDAEARRWIESTAIWFVPVVNPDGLQYVFDHDNYWRKNRARNADGSRGVDLNRNYAFKWGTCGMHSTVGSSDVYKGRAPLSEAETTVMDRLNARLRAQYLVSYHSYGDEVLYPYLCGRLAEEGIYYSLRDRLAEELGYGTRKASSSGEDFEHHYAKYGTLAFLIEMGSTFQPSYDTYRNEMWPALRKALPFLLRELHSGHVHVRVRDAVTGKGLAARLSLDEIAFQEGETREADAFGSYRWRLGPGRYRLTATLEGYRPTTVTVEATGRLDQVSVELEPDANPALGLLSLGKRWLVALLR